MFVVTLTYVVPLDRVDEVSAAHAEWLDEYFDVGVFVAAGRQIPRTGGVILATGVNRIELDALLATDPFATEGIAEYSIVEFEALKIAPQMKPLLPAAKASVGHG